MILLDTNLLVRVTSPDDPGCAPARAAVHRLRARGEQVVIVPQNLYEFWVVATRAPGRPPGGQNGLGMTVAQASRWVDFFRRRLTLLPDPPDLPARWHDLVRSRGVRGYRAHDARLAAAMQCYGIAGLLTFDAADFRDLGVATLDPHQQA